MYVNAFTKEKTRPNWIDRVFFAKKALTRTQTHHCSDWMLWCLPDSCLASIQTEWKCLCSGKKTLSMYFSFQFVVFSREFLRFFQNSSQTLSLSQEGRTFPLKIYALSRHKQTNTTNAKTKIKTNLDKNWIICAVHMAIFTNHNLWFDYDICFCCGIYQRFTQKCSISFAFIQ